MSKYSNFIFKFNIICNQLYKIDDIKVLLIDVLPSKCEYQFVQYYSVQKDNCKSFYDKFERINEQIVSIRLSSIWHHELLSDEEFSFMKIAVSSPNSKIYLRKVNLRIDYLDDAIKLLDLLSEWRNLESVDLRYRNISLIYMTMSPEEWIRDAINKFIRKVGIINRLWLYHK